jgi:hypothetical protein
MDALKVNLEHLKMERDVDSVVQTISQEIVRDLGLQGITVNTLKGTRVKVS